MLTVLLSLMWCMREHRGQPFGLQFYPHRMVMDTLHHYQPVRCAIATDPFYFPNFTTLGLNTVNKVILDF
jgi:hypothetical protein